MCVITSPASMETHGPKQRVMPANHANFSTRCARSCKTRRASWLMMHSGARTLAQQQSRGCTHVTCCCPTSHSDRCLPERWGCGRWCQNSPAPASGGRSSQPAAALQCQLPHSSTQAAGRTHQQAGQPCLGTACDSCCLPQLVADCQRLLLNCTALKDAVQGFQPLPVRQEQTARPAQRRQCPDGSACRSCSGRSFE